MKPFSVHQGIVAPLDRPDVDTDAMVPKQFLKSIRRSGFGSHLFDEWRYLDRGELGIDLARRKVNPNFVLNQARYAGASILLARRNFGAGSSREHAQWALAEYGFRALIAPSFADIFLDNCMRNGLVAIVLDESTVDCLFAWVEERPGYELSVDLSAQTIGTPDGRLLRFNFDPFHKARLLAGLDDIGATLVHREQIERYEAARFVQRPWLRRVRQF
jgi:3-isopropylmalate/(R)-2-methylmalate dehydratase small subunit